MNDDDAIQVKRSGKWVDATLVEQQATGRVIVRVDGKRRGFDSCDVREVRAARVPTVRAIEPEEVRSLLVEGEAVAADWRARMRAPIVETPKARPTRSDSYLAFVREHPCCCCGQTAATEAHHIVNGGMGKKASDRLTAPLTAEHHAFWHAHGYLPGRDRIESLGCMWEACGRMQDEWDNRLEEGRK